MLIYRACQLKEVHEQPGAHYAHRLQDTWCQVGHPNLKVALLVAGSTAVAGGAAVAKLVGRPVLMGGLRQFVAAFLGTDVAFLMGQLVGGHVG
jgi:hypothetical protein